LYVRRDDLHGERQDRLFRGGFSLDLGANRRRAEELLFEYFSGRLSQSGVADWFKTWMSQIPR